MSLSPRVRRTFSEERGTGTFHTLGILPKRKPSPVFHLAHDDDDDDHSSSRDEPSPSVPFPRSASPPSCNSPPSSSDTSPHPHLRRDASAPILLSNGKPLKSSLKTSSSSPAILTPPQAQHMHLRARSEPSTPAATPKTVHFPEKGYALATVRIYNRSARPAALSSPADPNGDETETEGEDTLPTRFPFPPLSPAFNYEIDPTKSSPVPSEFSLSQNLLIDSLNLSPSSQDPVAKPLLTGSILVRNLAFEKHVAVRFTLDDWQTVSEVGAHYVGSLSLLPSHILLSIPVSTSGDPSPHTERGWDRFTFTIRLEDYAPSLTTRTLWLAAHYRIDSTYPEPGSAKYGPGGEWWDNNGGRNYRIRFRPVLASPQTRPRRETISAPIPSPRTQSQPATTFKEHVFGHMLPSVPNNREVQPVNESDRRSTPRAGKLSLCNYASPTVRVVTSSISFRPVSSPQRSSPSTTNSELPPLLRPTSEEDAASPASSALPTPSASPTMAPCVIINGQFATSVQPHRSCEKVDPTTSGHIPDWDWSSPRKLQMEGLARQHPDPVPTSDPPERRRDIPSPTGRLPIVGSNSLYEAFVTQWCFAQGPSSTHNGYDNGGIIA
ncbi:carbohydrate-binding module family 21 protein [Butyriboletus roseoflavus]|nr:carbohydrate-binding module family 21 protein [Butyriboletus roseoflavus]